MGGGTTKIGDPTGRDESRKMLTDEQIAANMAEHQAGVRPVPDIRRRPDRRRHGQQRRLAGQAANTSRSCATSAPFHDQPHADLRQRQAAAGARAADDLPRIQLHDPAGLRLPGTVPPGTAAGSRWAGRTSGATSSTASNWAAASIEAEPVRPDDAADHDRRPASRWARPRGGAVWLNADRLSPYDYWQFWRNTEDGDVGRFLRLFTELPLDEIAELEKLEGAGINEAKKRPRLRGDQARPRRSGGAGSGGNRPPHLRAGRAGRRPADGRGHRATTLAAGIPVVDLLVRAELAASKGEARRLIKGNGARLNDAAIGDEARSRDGGRSERGRRDEAVRRQEAARPDPRGLGRTT